MRFVERLMKDFLLLQIELILIVAAQYIFSSIAKHTVFFRSFHTILNFNGSQSN